MSKSLKIILVLVILIGAGFVVWQFVVMYSVPNDMDDEAVVNMGPPDTSPGNLGTSTIWRAYNSDKFKYEVDYPAGWKFGDYSALDMIALDPQKVASAEETNL